MWVLAAWDLGFHTKQPSHVTPSFKLSHLCPHGPLGTDGVTVDGGGDGDPHYGTSHAANSSWDRPELTFPGNSSRAFKPSVTIHTRSPITRGMLCTGTAPRRHHQGSQPRPCCRSGRYSLLMETPPGPSPRS